MVVFTCNYCGDSVNKPKADKHVSIECKRKRYGYASLCCVDCLQDFDFYSYKSHIKCMTEEERYSAPGFVPKPSSCKGEKKQSSWIDSVSTLLEKPTLSKLHRSVLQSISSFQNIPRKKSKFLNFMTSSAGYRNSDYNLLETVFNLIESEFKSSNSPAPATVRSPVKEEKSSDNASQNSENTSADLPVLNGKKSPKAEEQKNVPQEPENTSNDLPVENGTESPKLKEKKKKKHKSRVDEESAENVEPLNEHSNNTDVLENINEDDVFTNVQKSKKKKKEKKDIDVPMEITETDAKVEDVDMNVPNSNNDLSFQNDDRLIAKSRGKKKHKQRDATLTDEIVANGVDESSEVLIPENTNPTSLVEENLDEKPERKKKKRKLNQAEDDVNSKRSRIETTENEISPKFSWSNVVKTLLEKSKDHEMSVKRMTKKVVAEYQSFHSNDESFEDIARKFNKKVKKLPFVIVSKDRIQLYVE